MYELEMKCKDFDAWISFLGRLNKIGSQYFIKNDVIMAVKKGLKSGSTKDRIPGRHLTRDPLFIAESGAYVPDGTYIMESLESIIEYAKKIKESKNKDYRKKILYLRDINGIYIRFNTLEPFKIASLLTIDMNSKDVSTYVELASGVTWFDNMLDTIDEWITLPDEELVNLRNNHVLMLNQVVDDIPMWSRVARSIFVTSGVSRLNTPLARKISYTFIDLKTKDNIGILRIHALYNNPGGSKIVNVECIHEYTILIYNEEGES